MFIGVQVGLVAVGLFIMSRGRFSIGEREVGNPIASLVGIVFAAQLPLALLVSIILGLTDGPPAPAIVIPTHAGQPPIVSNVVAPREANDNWWVDPLVTCTAVLAAAGLTGMALRSDSESDAVLASLHPADADPAP